MKNFLLGLLTILFYIVFFAAIVGGLVWLSVFFVRCSCATPRNEKICFDVDILEKNSDYAKILLKNDTVATKYEEIHLLLYGFTVRITSDEGTRYEYDVELCEFPATERGDVFTNTEFCYAPGEGYEYTVTKEDLYSALKNPLYCTFDEIDSIKIRNINFVMLTVSKSLADSDNQFFEYKSFDYYFDVATEKEAKAFKYTVSLNNLIAGAEYYDVKNIKFRAVTNEGKSFDFLYCPSDLAAEKYDVAKDKGFTLTFTEDFMNKEIIKKAPIGVFGYGVKIVSCDIVDVNFFVNG